jgi:hypothetical protein
MAVRPHGESSRTTSVLVRKRSPARRPPMRMPPRNPRPRPPQTRWQPMHLAIWPLLSLSDRLGLHERQPCGPLEERAPCRGAQAEVSALMHRRTFLASLPFASPAAAFLDEPADLPPGLRQLLSGGSGPYAATGRNHQPISRALRTVLPDPFWKAG